MRLDIALVRERTKRLRVGSDLRYCPEIDSTNVAARSLVDARTGTVIITDFQAAGRGRHGRSWTAPAGSSLLLSVLLDIDVGPAYIVMMATLAVADAIATVTALVPELKWPNDVLIGSRKVAGILAERIERAGEPRYVVGIGVNVNFDPRSFLSIPATASSLSAALGREVNREELAVALFERLNMWYGGLTRNPSGVYRAWLDRLNTLGVPLTISEGRRTWYGIGLEVQPDGGLVVQGEDGVTRTVYAADVTVRRSGLFTKR